MVSLFQKIQNRFGEVIAPGDNALHVMLLVLNRTEQHRILQINHRRHAAAARAKESPLAFGRAINDVVGRAEELAYEFGLALVERALQMRGQEAVHHVHTGRQAEFGHATQDQRLVGGLLRVLAKDDDPTRVERAVNVIVAAMHIQGVFGQRARADFQDHRRTFAGSVIILFDAVNNTLPRSVIDHAFAADRVGDGPTLGRVLAFGLDGECAVAEDIEFTFGKRLMIQLTALG
ncbi:MAG: hypothetical protein JMDDDDMK_03735 [Acidobacteria bacterium]|nr:hypothetical protein [Acidobacteriota bacterium]